MNFKKILISVDASENAKRAVSYVGEIVGGRDEFEIELLCIACPPQRDIFPDEATWKKSCQEYEAEIKNFFKICRQILEAKGVPGEKINENYFVCSAGGTIAQNILAVQQEGEFGTIVVGRRGISKADEFLFGSVSNKIVHYAKNCTVWVVE